jgi:hypothetical protein
MHGSIGNAQAGLPRALRKDAPSADAEKSAIDGCRPGEKMLEVLQKGGVYPKQTDDSHTNLSPIPSYRDARRSGIGDEMLRLAGNSGSHYILRRQYRKEGEKYHTAPCEHAKCVWTRCMDATLYIKELLATRVAAVVSDLGL